MGDFHVEFKPSGRGKAQCPPDPQFPNGVTINAANHGQPFCEVALPYPAPECGHYVVRCSLCDMSVAITAAGRPDDPRSLTMPCRLTRTRKVN